MFKFIEYVLVSVLCIFCGGVDHEELIRTTPWCNAGDLISCVFDFCFFSFTSCLQIFSSLIK